MSIQQTQGNQNYPFKQIALNVAGVQDKAVFRLNGKVPLKGSNGFKDATRDQDQINRWWDTTPNANPGIPTGADNDLYVLDFDCGKGGQDLVARFEEKYGLLPRTRVVRTGSGFHYWFRYPGGLLGNTASKLLEYVDTRGEGGYVLAPGSLHPNGKYYELVDPTAPIADLPEHLIEALENARGRSSSKHASSPDGMIPDGQRSDRLISYAGSMRNNGMTVDEIEGALKVINRNRCQPPLDEDEVRKIAESAGRYEPKRDLGAVDHYADEAEQQLRSRCRTSDVFEAFNALFTPDYCPPEVANTLRLLVGKARGLADGKELFFTDYEGGMWIPGAPDVDDDSVARRWKRATTEADEWQQSKGKRFFRRTPGTNRVRGSKTVKASTYEVQVLDAIIEVVRIAIGTKKTSPDIYEGLKKKDLKRPKRFALATAYVRENFLPVYDPEEEKIRVKGGNTLTTSLVGKNSRDMNRFVRAFGKMLGRAIEEGDREVVILVGRAKDRLAEMLKEKGCLQALPLLRDEDGAENKMETLEANQAPVSTHGKAPDWTEPDGQKNEPTDDLENAHKLKNENAKLQSSNDLDDWQVDTTVQLLQSDKVRSWWADRVNIGAALREIRDEKLYGHEYATFEEFYEKEFGLTPSEVSELMESAVEPEPYTGPPIPELVIPADVPSALTDKWLMRTMSEDELIEWTEREAIRMEGNGESLDQIPDRAATA